MDFAAIPDIRGQTQDLRSDLGPLLQHRLLAEHAFLGFAKDRGMKISGVVRGDPGDFHARGWLFDDGLTPDGQPLFHPFRILPIHMVLRVCGIPISQSATLRPKATVLDLVSRAWLQPDLDRLSAIAVGCNRIADLAVILEPRYWPPIAGAISKSVMIDEQEFDAAMDAYGRKVSHFIGTLDSALWRGAHEWLRHCAAMIDDNHELYLLLRLATWDQRLRLKGHVSGALWIRHIAEVLRRGFEEVHGEQWPEEDEAFGMWPRGGRRFAFGSERPLDDATLAKPYIARLYGLLTGSRVRWYVEGDTEYFAILAMMPDPSRALVEIVNLKGAIASGRDSAALRLGAMLEQDRRFRRFSMISFDRDVAANLRAIRGHVERGEIVGFVAAHDPDFEAENFTVTELGEVAARIDEKHGHSGGAVRNADWSGVRGAAAFEECYCRVSVRRPRSLKGEEWGRALATFAAESPRRPDDGRRRPFLDEVDVALRARGAHYDYQKEHSEFDRVTFELRRIPGT